MTARKGWNVPVSRVPGNLSTGTANKVVTLSTGQYGSESYVIRVELTGNYTNSTQSIVEKTATVVVRNGREITSAFGNPSSAASRAGSRLK